MKRISVKLVGSANLPFTINVTPDMTAGEVLSKLDLADYVLAIPPAPNRYFAPEEQVYEELLEGDYLLAVHPPVPSVAPLEEIAEQQAPALKALTIRIFGSKRRIVPIRIQPGTTALDLLASLKLSLNYVIVPAAPTVADIPQTIFNERFAPLDDLYERTQEGDKLIVIPASDAARIAFDIMMSNASLKEPA